MSATKRKRMLRYPTAVLLLVGIAVVAGYLVWSNWPKSALDRLRADPVASLTYPGSTLIGVGGYDSGWGAEYNRLATWSRNLGSGESIAAVLAFYREQMRVAGWATGGGSTIISADFEQQVCAWHKDGMIFRLGFWKPERWVKSRPNSVAYPTVYAISLMKSRSGNNDIACANPDL